jgi:O-antigen/teichoic acid export membrane protein
MPPASVASSFVGEPGIVAILGSEPRGFRAGHPPARARAPLHSPRVAVRSSAKRRERCVSPPDSGAGPNLLLLRQSIWYHSQIKTRRHSDHTLWSVCVAPRSPNEYLPRARLEARPQLRSSQLSGKTRRMHTAFRSKPDRTGHMSLKLGIIRLLIASISPTCMVVLRFVRTIILSHLLAPDNLGAAVALMTILVGCEMITDVGLDRFVIVTVGKNRAQAVAVAQQIALGRAICLAAAIAIFAPQLASMFGATEHLKGVAWLGLVSLIAGFRNWRLVQIQQDYRYGPDTLVTVCGELAGVALILPAALWFQDERAILVSLITEAVVHVTLSNILIKREKVARVDASMRKAVFKWSVPLMVNGVGLMAVKQLDQVIVANLFDLKTLALYALGLNLAITPTALLQAIGQKIGLPFLANAKANLHLARQASLLALLISSCVAAAYALPVGLLLSWLVPLLYGHQYQVTQTFCALAMLDAFLRFCRGGPNMILLHLGQTSRLTVGNLVAGVGTAVALALGIWSMRLEGVMIGLVVGDLVSLILLIALLHRHLPIGRAFIHTGLMTVTTSVAAAVIWAASDITIAERALVFIIGGVMIGIDAVVVFSEVGRDFFAWPATRIARNVISARHGEPPLPLS